MKENEIIDLKFLPDDGNMFFEKISENNGLHLYKNKNEFYMILEREFSDDFVLDCLDNLGWMINVISLPKSKFKIFIVDMNGIDNFITSKSLVFSDATIRKLMLVHLYLRGKNYYRFGVSGSRPSPAHPGGEVVELQELDYSTNTGVSNSISGCMDLPENEFSKAIPLSEDGFQLREERTVYSHTAWIEKEENNAPIKIEVSPQNDDQSLLMLLYDLCKSMNLDATGIAIKFSGCSGIKVKGRVLKHIPDKAFKVLQEATDIAVEKEFILPCESQMHLYGTLYKRFEPEWKEFTGGRQYEKRGHFHSFILGDNLENVHEVFHVREILVDKSVSITLEIYPANKIYRIYQVNYIDGKYRISSSNKEIVEHAESFKNENKEL